MSQSIYNIYTYNFLFILIVVIIMHKYTHGQKKRQTHTKKTISFIVYSLSQRWFTASTKDGHAIKSLNNHTDPLAQFQIGEWVTSVRPSAMTLIFEKCSGILPKNTCGLERH